MQRRQLIPLALFATFSTPSQLWAREDGRAGTAGNEQLGEVSFLIRSSEAAAHERPQQRSLVPQVR